MLKRDAKTGRMLPAMLKVGTKIINLEERDIIDLTYLRVYTVIRTNMAKHVERKRGMCEPINDNECIILDEAGHERFVRLGIHPISNWEVGKETKHKRNHEL